jgi:hypothetical protein
MATEGYLATTQRYDVFLSHTSGDKDAVERIARRLRAEAQLEPFLDKWHLIPGNPWQEELEQALNQSHTCAVFLGPADLGPWENEEMRLALDKRTVNPAFRVIPVLLPNTQMPDKGPLPGFLRRVTWVDTSAAALTMPTRSIIWSVASKASRQDQLGPRLTNHLYLLMRTSAPISVSKPSRKKTPSFSSDAQRLPSG